MTNVADILARQITKRCDAQLVTSGADSFKIELAVEPGIGTDGFRNANTNAGRSVPEANNERAALNYRSRAAIRQWAQDADASSSCHRA